MNRIYNLVWNHVLGVWTVASEYAKSQYKKGRAKRLSCGLSLLALPFFAPLVAADLPSGGQIVLGQGQITQPAGNHLSINQGSAKLAIDWQQFNIGEGNRVSFHQPSAEAIALNRVIGTDGSRIMGQLDANGRVFLVNPNGVLFGKNAQVDVGGLVASTLIISNDDFAAGNYRFRGDGENAAVINKGSITAADGGAVALLGGRVSNEGVISARLGTVALLAGEQVTLDFAGDGLLKVQIDEATRDALVENHQLIQADGGQVLMNAHAADALLQTVVNNTGVIEARALENRSGKIVLLGGFGGGTVEVAGKLDASAPEGGNGGFIDTSGANVQIHEGVQVTTLAAHGRTGDWLIDPTDFTVSAGSSPQNPSGIGAETLSLNLENNNVTLQTVAGGSEAGDIHVNAEVSWDAATTLTLSAQGDIHINQNISATTGKLALEYGQLAVAAGNTADYHLRATVNLSAGQNFSTRLGLDGATIEYTVITELGAPGSTTGTDLQGINGNLSGHYALGADINASATAGWNGGEGFDPIGFFSGTLHGLGHEIHGLTIDRPSEVFVGLFSIAGSGAQLRNVGVRGGRAVGERYVGGLVGQNSGVISQSYATSTVGGNAFLGGLAGFNSGVISQSYATGTVEGNSNYISEYIGGLAGFNTGGMISQSYAMGATSGVYDVGGLAGYSDGTITESYWNIETTGQSSSAGGRGLTTAELIAALPAGFDPEVWGNAGNQTTPYLLGLSGNQVFNKNDLPSGIISVTTRPALYTVIQDVHQLQAVQNGLDGRYVLGNNIDAAATIGWNGGAGFNPIGSRGNPFTGIFDGLGHEIRDLAINRPSQYFVGLFGEVNGSSAAIRNLGLRGGGVSGGFYAGGLVGYLKAGAISQSYTTGPVSGDRFVGGLVGETNGGTISQSYATGTAVGAEYIGGLVGAMWSGTISQSYSSGAVNAVLSQVGGLAGLLSDGTIRQSYATGTVDGFLAGGLVGVMMDGTISQSYATGAVSGREIGGLVGQDTRGTITQSYWNIETTGQTFSSGGGTGLTTAEMRQLDSFAGWDIDDQGGSGTVWRIYEGHTTPLLRVFLTPFQVNIDDMSVAYNGTSEHALNSDQLSHDTPTLDLITDSLRYQTSSRNTGSYSGTDLRLEGLYSTQLGYDIILTTGKLDVNPAALTISSENVSKTYDGTTDAAGAAVAIGGTQLYGGDTFSGGDFAFTDRNAGSNKTVTVANVTINDGNGGNNYIVSYVENTTSTINKAALTVSAVDQQALYDGAKYGGGFTVDYDGFVNGESETVLGGSPIFGGDSENARNAGTYSITVSGLTADNYDISYRSGTLTIDPATLIISTLDISKIYDGTTAAKGIVAAVAGTQLFGGDTFSGGDFSFMDPNAGVGNKIVTVANVTINDGNGSNNYTITYADNTTSTISPYVIDLRGHRVYDGSRAVGAEILSLGSLVGSEMLTLLGSGLMGDRHVGDGKILQLDTLTLADGTNGGLASNYTLIGGNHSVDITPATLIISTSNISKIYDGVTDAVGNAVATGGTQLFHNDRLSGGVFAFSDKNVGLGNKTVTVSDVIVEDGNKGKNYSISYQHNTTSSITPATLIANAGAVEASRVYDGTTQAAVISHGSLSGLIGSDEVELLLINTNYADKHVGSGKRVSGTYSISGADAGNYVLTDIDFVAHASITPRLIRVVADDKHKYQGQSDPAFTWRYDASALAGGDSAESVFSGALSREAGEAPGSYLIGLGNLQSHSDYAIDFLPGELRIEAAGITRRLAARASVYQNTLVAALNAMLSNEADGREVITTDSENLYTIVDGGLRLPEGL